MLLSWETGLKRLHRLKTGLAGRLLSRAIRTESFQLVSNLCDLKRTEFEGWLKSCTTVSNRFYLDGSPWNIMIGLEGEFVELTDDSSELLLIVWALDGVSQLVHGGLVNLTKKIQY